MSTSIDPLPITEGYIRYPMRSVILTSENRHAVKELLDQEYPDLGAEQLDPADYFSNGNAMTWRDPRGYIISVKPGDRIVITNAIPTQVRAEDADHWWHADGQDHDARAALAELVRLKDGPRDAAYERDKPLAWAAARAALARTAPAPEAAATPGIKPMSWGDLIDLTYEQRQALPAVEHRPVLDSLTTPAVWICRVCWDEGLLTAWPCAPATDGGRALATAAGLEAFS